MCVMFLFTEGEDGRHGLVGSKMAVALGAEDRERVLNFGEL